MLQPAGSLLERLFLVRPDEKRAVVYFLLFFALTGAGFAIGKGAAEALFFKRFGIQYLPLVYMALSVLLATTSMIYATLADRLPSETFFLRSYLLLVLTVIICWFLMVNDSNSIYPVFYLLYEVASEILLIHSAVYISQNFELAQSKRIFSLVMGGLQLGKIIGGITLTAGSAIIALHNMVLIWAGLLVFGAFMLYRHHAAEGRSPYYAPGRKKPFNVQSMAEQLRHGFAFLRQTRLTRNASYSMFFMVVSFYTLWYAINTIYTDTFESEQALGSFFGVLTVVNGVAALILQLFVTNRLIARLGLQKTHFIYPLTTIFSYFALLFSFSLPSALIGSINLGAILPAIRNPVRNLFFNVLPDYMQGRARALAMGMVLPAALMLTGMVLYFAGTRLPTNALLATGLLSALVYLFFTYRINQSYMQAILATLKEKLFIPEDSLHIHGSLVNDEMIAGLTKNIWSSDPATCLQNARWLLEIKPETAIDIIQKRLYHNSDAINDRLIRLIITSKHTLDTGVLHKTLDVSDDHLKASALYVLFENNDEKAFSMIESLLQSDNPRLAAVAAYGAWQAGIPELETLATNKAKTMLLSNNDKERLAMLDLAAITSLPININDIATQLTHQNQAIVAKALSALSRYSRIHSSELAKTLPALTRHTDSDIRMQAIKNLKLLDVKDFYSAILTALSDEHPEARKAAAITLIDYSSESAGTAIEMILNDSLPPRAQLSLLPELLKHGIRRKTLSEIASSKLRWARACNRAAIILQHSENPELLAYVLEERKHILIELCLLALNGIENPFDIAVIKAGLNCHDRRQIALSHEALRNLKNTGLAEEIGAMLDKTATPDTIPKNDITSELHELLDSFAAMNDPWMHENILHFKTKTSWA